jgi:nucleotide-binding universal stress UspA family protein
MTIRTILAAAGGGTATAGAIDLACRLAQRFAAHVEGFHVIADPRALFAATGEGVIPSSGLIEGLAEQESAKAAATRELFDAIAARHRLARSNSPQDGQTGPTAHWWEQNGYAPDLVAQRGRFFDLIVLGRSDRVVREPHSDTIEVALTHSGRPILLTPAEVDRDIGRVVAIGWNGSPQAVRALSAALPFLTKATAVELITIGAKHDHSISLALDYLAWHGIRAGHREGIGRRVGKALLDAATDCGADTLVMGGYSRTPWREFFFGGATREAVGRMPLPLFLVH